MAPISTFGDTAAAASNNPAAQENDYYSSSGEFRVDKGGSKILQNSLMYKMCYYRFGEVYTEQGAAYFGIYVSVALTANRQAVRLRPRAQCGDWLQGL